MISEAAPVEKLQIRSFQTIEQLQTIERAWQELLDSYPLATTFSTPQWLIPWWRNFGDHQQLLVLGFYDQPSRLCALAPLEIASVKVAKAASLRFLRLMGDGSHDSDNLDLPVRPGFEDAFAHTLVDYLESRRESWDVCDLNTLPRLSPAAGALQRVLQSKNWLVAAGERPASAVPLPPTWDEYLEKLSSEDRNNLTRYSRRLEKRYAVKIYRCTEEHQLQPSLDALFKLHQARWTSVGEAGSFGSSQRRSFYYELSRELLPRNRLDLWVMELNGAIAAVQFAFRHGHTVFQLQEGNDPERASDRVGFVLRGHVMRQLIADGIRTYDFLGGSLGYKARWGAEAAHYIDLRFARPFSLGAVYMQGQSYARSGKEWLRRKLPKQAWEKLRDLNRRVRKNSQP